MTELELVQKAIDDKIGKDIVTLKLDSAVADYFVIATANAPNHAQSIIDEVEKEGYSEGNWILLDLNDIIVHVFTEEARSFYDIERLWN